MSNNDLVSLIIPVYRVEKYLSRCLDSVLNQDYSNIEIILVDDGSPDSSPLICDEYAQRDPRISVIHKKNGGQSSARNAGLKVAKGHYVNFLDSDDWIAPDTVSYALGLLKKYGAEAVQYEYAHVSSADTIVAVPKEKIIVQKESAILEEYMKTVLMTGSYSVVRCMFKMSALEGISFREGKNSEDLDFKFNVLSHCKVFVLSNQYKYFYFQSPTSTSNGGLRTGDFDLYEAADILLFLVKSTKNQKVIKMAEAKRARTPFSLLCKMAYFGVNDAKISKDEMKKRLVTEHRASFTILMKSPIPFSRKILSILFALNYNLAEVCISICKKISSNYA